ncbi:MAG: rod shape-determining protein MreC [candidate division KSB1 bacterium]|nr:rod shape-determining protein MreC [candidate division KSB1 bacterium]MDZ7303562.1 rod shape-determining protein MreC [candidate division KSB1 bacterium]MDZ7312805.1 rod shape-determining protein MreC [candidate division KSB1 bacterium]
MKEFLLERPNLFFISKREYFTLIAAILASLYCLFNNDKPQIDAMRALFLDYYAILQEKFSWARKLAELQRENTELRRKATQMMLENTQLREAVLENHRLRQMLNFRERTSWNFRTGRVITKQRDETPVSVTIDIGSDNALRPNMPVVTPEGLVGKLYKVYHHTSIVQLMLDRNFSVSARVQRSRVLGIVTWSERSGLELTAVPRTSDVQIGDAVVTSDSSALFPPGLRIGLVSGTYEDKTSLFKTITLQPDVDFSRLEEVYVIISPKTVLSN